MEGDKRKQDTFLIEVQVCLCMQESLSSGCYVFDGLGKRKPLLLTRLKG